MDMAESKAYLATLPVREGDIVPGTLFIYGGYVDPPSKIERVRSFLKNLAAQTRRRFRKSKPEPSPLMDDAGNVMEF